MRYVAEWLLADAVAGRLPKSVLASLLAPEYRAAFLAACAAIEKRYTEACTAKNDPWLESGCALEGEVCLNPLVDAGVEYQKACGAEWAKLFADASHRADGWSAAYRQREERR